MSSQRKAHPAGGSRIAGVGNVQPGLATGAEEEKEFLVTVEDVAADIDVAAADGTSLV